MRKTFLILKLVTFPGGPRAHGKSLDKSYGGDNRATALGSPHLKGKMLPRCRFGATFPWKGGKGCHRSWPKAPRELGLPPGD